MPKITPNYLTVDPDGNVGANFSGHIKAAGVDLDAATSDTPPIDNRITWTRAADGAVTAKLFGKADNVNGGTLRLRSLSVPPTNFSAVAVEAMNANESVILARLTLIGDQNADTGTVVALARGQQKTIINSSEQSDFVQYAPSGLSRRRMSFVNFAMNFPGSAFSDTHTIAHNLGTTPSFLSFLAIAPSYNIGDAVVVNEVGLRDVSFIRLRGRTVSGAAIGPGTITVSGFVAA